MIDRFLDLEAKEAEMIDLKTEMIGLKTEYFSLLNLILKFKTLKLYNRLENKNRQIEEDKRAKSQLESELKKIRKEY